MGKPKGLQKKLALQSEINVTPLIDVVFILLVFFMLATSFTDWRPIVWEKVFQERNLSSANPLS